MIKDSGNRTEFEINGIKTGAVRDIQEGKGRCDLLPLDVTALIMEAYNLHRPLEMIDKFTNTGDIWHLNYALRWFIKARCWDVPTMLIETSIHFEEGSKKYGVDNWKKGLSARNYVNSMIRHYLKWARGDNDESHDRAFCWNVICCMWTCLHKPELNEYRKEENNVKD